MKCIACGGYYDDDDDSCPYCRLHPTYCLEAWSYPFPNQHSIRRLVHKTDGTCTSDPFCVSCFEALGADKPPICQTCLGSGYFISRVVSIPVIGNVAKSDVVISILKGYVPDQTPTSPCIVCGTHIVGTEIMCDKCTPFYVMAGITQADVDETNSFAQCMLVFDVSQYDPNLNNTPGFNCPFHPEEEAEEGSLLCSECIDVWQISETIKFADSILESEGTGYSMLKFEKIPVQEQNA